MLGATEDERFPDGGIASGEDVHALVARIYQALRTPFDCHDHQLSSDASIGIAIGPRDGADLFDLLKNADLAMYKAKQAGRSTHRFFSADMDRLAAVGPVSARIVAAHDHPARVSWTSNLDEGTEGADGDMVPLGAVAAIRVLHRLAERTEDPRPACMHQEIARDARSAFDQ